MYLSVIIPAYNEEERLPKTLAEIDKYLSGQSFDYEILVVDNGSTDNTVGAVRMLEGKIRGLKLLQGSPGQGKGFAVKLGMLEATGEYRIFTDADNSTPISEVEKMWPEFKSGYGVVIGSRDIKGAILDPPQPFLRNFILGNGFKLFRKIIIGFWGIEDTQCGFKGFLGKAAQDIFPKIKTLDFAFDSEILIMARLKGYKIKEIPIYWKNDLLSKVKLKSMIKMAVDLIKIKLNLIRGLYD
ncbi:MAG: glycosyltransferase family 2 protein [Candidatus Wildermuthbacteria bacterium]|nr:glycosyltransferase family 2 protein [Candidatus Wildermuthbacteria bacterium]